MKTVELLCRSILHLLLAASAASLVIRLCTGCTIIRQLGARENVAEVIKTAYAEGGKTAVSNKIESLVISGDLSAKQAAKLHELAEHLYDHVVEALEAEAEVDATWVSDPKTK